MRAHDPPMIAIPTRGDKQAPIPRLESSPSAHDPLIAPA
jgi:hypothetical protein